MRAENSTAFGIFYIKAKTFTAFDDSVIWKIYIYR